MKQTNFKLTSPAELGFFDEMEQRSGKSRRIISIILKVVGTVGIVVGLLIALSSVGEPSGVLVSLHDIIWQFWTGFIIFAAGVAVWYIGYEIKE